MARGFDNKDRAKEAGAKGRRGKAKIPHELKMALAEGSLDRVPKLWTALDALSGKDYLAYLTKILQLVVPKDLNIEGEIDIDGGDAKRKLIERLLARASEGEDNSDGK